MTDEEIRQEAHDVLIAAWQKSAAKYADSKRFTMCVNESGSVEFRLNYSDEMFGVAQFIFSPQMFIETIIRISETQLEKMEDSGSSDEELISAQEHFLREIDDTASILVRNIEGEFQSFVQTQGPLSLSLFLNGLGESHEWAFGLSNIQLALSDMKAQRKVAHKFFVKEIENSQVASPLLFAHFYAEHIKLWRDAKSCYKANAKFPNSMGVVKTAFPTLDARLVEQLSDLDNTSNTAEVMALRSTAALVGVPKGIRSKRSLQAYLKKGRTLLKKATISEVQETLQNFLNYEEYHKSQSNELSTNENPPISSP